MKTRMKMVGAVLVVLGLASVAMAGRRMSTTNEVSMAERIVASVSSQTAEMSRTMAAKEKGNNMLNGCQTNTVAEAETKAKSDPEVERYLRERGLKFGYCDDGDFRLTFETDGGRSQQVFISSELHELDGMKIRKVSSAAYRGRLTKPMLLELLREDYKIGFWHVEAEQAPHKDVVWFIAQVPWDIMPADFETVLRVVARTADDKEGAWSDGDEL